MGGDQLFFERKKPTVDYLTKGAQIGPGHAQAFHQATVNGLESMKRRFVFRNLYLAACKIFAFGPFLEPSGKESFAATIITPHRFKGCTACRDKIQQLINREDETFEAHRKLPKPFGRHGAPPQGFQQFRAFADGYGGGLHENQSGISNCLARSLRSSRTVSDWRSSSRT